MGFSMQEYWSWLPFPPLGDLPVPGIELRSLHWQANSLSLTHQESHYSYYHHFIILKPQTKVAAAAANSLQSCPTLCDLIDGSPPGSAIPGILQARILEWVAISFSNHESKDTLAGPKMNSGCRPSLFILPGQPLLASEYLILKLVYLSAYYHSKRWNKMAI